MTVGILSIEFVVMQQLHAFHVDDDGDDYGCGDCDDVILCDVVDDDATVRHDVHDWLTPSSCDLLDHPIGKIHSYQPCSRRSLCVLIHPCN